MPHTDPPQAKNAAPALQIDAQLGRAIIDSALDCIITMDAEGLIREFNPAAERVFGYARSDVIGRELASLIIPPTLRERHRAGLAHYLKTGEGPVLNRRIEIAAVRADGAEILVELAITPIKTGPDSIFSAYLRDITERVRTERRRKVQYGIASLLASSLTLREIGSEIVETIASSGDWCFGSIWVRDDEEGHRCITTWQSENGPLDEFSRITLATTLTGSHGLPGRVIHAARPVWVDDVRDDRDFPRGEAARAAGIRGAFACPLRAETVVNGVLELMSCNVVLPDEDLVHLMDALGTQIGLFIHRRQIERELQQQKERAEAANAAKDRFLANLSHELRTPLTPVLIWAGGLAPQQELPDDLREGLDMVCRNVELEARLIDDLLDLTRISQGKIKLEQRVVDAHELLAHARKIVASSLQDRTLEIVSHCEATNAVVRVDPARLQQAFWNLLRNACKFTPDGGRIEIRTENPTPDRLRVTVSDTGSGIEAEHLESIFNAFEQLGPRREGLGLGLAISKTMVEMHGGKISAESAGLGQGSRFCIELPLHDVENR